MRRSCFRLRLAFVPEPAQHRLVLVQALRDADEVGRKVGLGREAVYGPQIGAKAQRACAARGPRAAASELSPRHYSRPPAVLAIAPRIGGSIRFGASLATLSAFTGLPPREDHLSAFACGRVVSPSSRHDDGTGDQSGPDGDQHKPIDPRYLGDDGHDAEGHKGRAGGNEDVSISGPITVEAQPGHSGRLASS